MPSYGLLLTHVGAVQGPAVTRSRQDLQRSTRMARVRSAELPLLEVKEGAGQGSADATEPRVRERPWCLSLGFALARPCCGRVTSATFIRHEAGAAGGRRVLPREGLRRLNHGEPV